MQIEIGGRKVVGSANLIIPKNEAAVIEILAVNRVLRAQLRVERDASGEQKDAAINVQPVDNEAHITLSGWDNPLGTATTQPFEVARLDENQALYCMIAHHRIGDVDRLDLSFLVGS